MACLKVVNNLSHQHEPFYFLVCVKWCTCMQLMLDQRGFHYWSLSLYRLIVYHVDIDEIFSMRTLWQELLSLTVSTSSLHLRVFCVINEFCL